jgi:hypothetical protein
VNKEVLLYIWDQYIIGLDSAGFTDDYLPVVTAVFLKLVVDRLKKQKLVLRFVCRVPEEISVPLNLFVCSSLFAQF